MVASASKAASIELMTSAVKINSTPSPTSIGSVHKVEDAVTAEQEERYRAKRYALKFQPPCIFLEYEDSSKKRRVRAVKLNAVESNVDVDRLTRKVIRSFPRKIDQASVKYDQVRKLVVKLLEYLAAAEGAANGGSTTSPGTATSGVLSAYGQPPPLQPTSSPRTDPRGPCGRLAAYLPNGGAYGDYRTSVESTMSRFSTSTGGSSEEAEAEGDGGGETSGEGRDELTSALDDLSRELGAPDILISGSGPSTRGHPSDLSSPADSRDSSFSLGLRDRAPSSSLLAGRPGDSTGGNGSALDGPYGGGAGGKSRFAAEAEKLVIGLDVSDDMDLNKVTDVELRMAKQAMEQDFRKNQLKPGDPGYEYDKQEEFGPPTEDNDWDESGDEEVVAPSEEPDVDWDEIHASVARKPSAEAGKLHTGGSVSPGGECSNQSSYNSNDWP